MHDANCTYDHEKMKIMKKMKRKRLWEFRPLLYHVGDSTRRAWMRGDVLQRFFAFFFFKEARRWLLGFCSSKMKSPLT